MYVYDMSLVIGALITLVKTDKNPNILIKLKWFIIYSVLVYILFCLTINLKNYVT